MSKIVVFGADGFIGRNLSSALAKSSDNVIVAFDRPAAFQSGKAPFDGKHQNVQIVRGDFFNRADVSVVLQDAQYVFHLVSTTNPAASDHDPFIDIDTNVRGSIELLELCVEHGVGKVIFPSSGGTIYGDIDSDTINELQLPRPRSPYGIGKLTIEHYLRYFKHSSNLDYIVYRIANPYGPGQNIYGKQGIIPIFMHKALTKESVVIYGKGDMVRDYIYIQDVVDMIVGTFEKPNQYSEYNIGSGNGVSVNEIVSLLEKVTGTTFAKQNQPTPTSYVKKSVLDTERFKSEFSLSAITPLEEGLAATWRYVQELP